MEQNKKPEVKKIIVELDNGKKLEFSNQFVLYAEDVMSETEKAMSASDNSVKICGVVCCGPQFAASVCGSMLDTIHEKTPGLDTDVILKHLVKTDDMARMLAEILG